MSTTSNGEPLHLLRTKLYRPRVAGDLVQRSRLHDTLNRYLDRAVTLICAPAGFGKTTVLTEWLEHAPGRSAWLSLDKNDSDLGVFVAYFVAAVRTVFPSACPGTRALLDASVQPALGVLVTALTNDLDHLADDPALPPGQRFILVLDDYHLVREPAVHSLLGELLRHPPRALHLIVGTRQDPPFLEHALRARADFSEIRIGDLRFTAAEAESFMQKTLQTPLDEFALAHLVDRIEGWGTGLRLTALALNAGGEVPGADLFDNRYTFEYLIAEVLSRVPAATQEFLLKTSILDRLSGPLCDEVTPPADPAWNGQAFLDWLVEQNLFVFSLDAQGAWRRYHHLFQKLLRAQLERRFSKAQIAELHRRAAGWFADNGLVQEAIEHALAAGDDRLAVQVLEMHRHPEMNRDHWRQLEQWLALLPPRLIDTRPELLMLEAWVLQNQWRLAELPPLLERIECLMQQVPLDEADRIRLSGEVDALRAVACYYALDGKAAHAAAQRALAALPLACSAARGTAWMYIPNGHFMVGDVQGTIEAYRQGLAEDRLHGNAFPARLYVGLCHVYWLRADPTNVWLTATQLLQIGQQRNVVQAEGWARYFRGCALYQQNDLVGAEKEFASVVRQRYVAHAFPFSQGGLALVLTLAGLGRFEQATEVLDSIAAYGLEVNNSRVMADAAAIRACLARRTGAVAEAHRWAAAFDPNTPLVPLMTFSVPHMVRARVLVAEGSPASLAEASKGLARLHNLAVATYNTRYLIEVLALEAVIQEGQGKQAVALATMTQSLELAEAGGLIRVFADLGPKVAALLRQIIARGGTSAFRQKLLAALVAPDATPTAAPPAARPLADPAVDDGASLLEPLSRRELEVLLLLSERLTDKEIARELFVSPQTVKRHASNIYQKLDVGNRRDAVAKATAFGLIPKTEAGRRRSQSVG